MHLCSHLSRLVSIPIIPTPCHAVYPRTCRQLSDIPLTGPYNCVGKQLAYMEIRSVTSSILRRYNVGLAPGQTSKAFMDGIVDGFTIACPKLDLMFTPRG